jgi:hypothetical protein
MCTRPSSPPERTELHNASIDDAIGATGCCAMVHLPTGRVCVRENRHHGSCEFAPADEVRGLGGSGSGIGASAPSPVKGRAEAPAQ